MIDTHCHLDFHAFDDDRDAVIARAREAGVTRMVIPAIDLETARDAIKLSDQYPEVFAAVGFHPNDLSQWNSGSIPALEALAQHPKVIALGEIGLDYYRDRTPKEVQQTAFRAQLELANHLSKPVIIHCRDDARGEGEFRPAMEDILTNLAEWRPKRGMPGVLHSFAGPESAAQRAIGLGFFIGITGPVTFSSARKLQELVQSLPLENLLIETDSPFLAPHPYRGQRNEPAYVRRVAEKIAELKALPLNIVAEQTSRNAAALFGWRD